MRVRARVQIIVISVLIHECYLWYSYTWVQIRGGGEPPTFFVGGELGTQYQMFPPPPTFSDWMIIYLDYNFYMFSEVVDLVDLKKVSESPPPPPPHQLVEDLHDSGGWRRGGPPEEKKKTV